MSQAKEEAIALIERLPETVTTADILEELLFKQQVERGLQDVAAGRTISHAELKDESQTLMNSSTRDGQVESLYQDAMALIDEEWLAEGASPDELNQSKRPANRFLCEDAAGLVADEALKAAGKTAEAPPMAGSRG